MGVRAGIVVCVTSFLLGELLVYPQWKAYFNVHYQAPYLPTG